MVFGRLWRELGIDRALAKLAKGRRFEFSLERVIFASVLQRWVNPGSDRAASRWLENYTLAGDDILALQHFYRSMAWLGTPLSEDEQDGAPRRFPRAA